jgi:hypothetical protein
MSQAKGSRNGLRRVRWGFDSGPTFPGFTDDSTWNGFLNVWVTPQVHARVIKMIEMQEKKYPGESIDTIEEMREMAPDLRGLISYANGYTTQEE